MKLEESGGILIMVVVVWHEMEDIPAFWELEIYHFSVDVSDFVQENGNV